MGNYLLEYLTKIEVELPMDPAIADEYTMGYRAGFNDALDKVREEYEATSFLTLCRDLRERKK